MGQNIATESSYAYTARDGTCKSSFTTAIPSGGVTGYKDCSGTSALTNAIQSRPVSVAIQADQAVFQQYTSGTITSGCGSNFDHGVTAVGINSDGSNQVKNSWGSSMFQLGSERLRQHWHQPVRHHLQCFLPNCLWLCGGSSEQGR